MAKLRASAVYLSETKAIVAANYYNADGIYYEQDDPLVVSDWRDGARLSGSLRQALGLFAFKERNLRYDKLKDWPSYRASRCRSVSEFERAYQRFWVIAFNDAELLYDASVKPSSEENLSLHATLNPFSGGEEFARPLERLFDICSRWDLMLD